MTRIPRPLTSPSQGYNNIVPLGKGFTESG